MFYKTGVDITNDKQMFKFLKNHFGYYSVVASYFSGNITIANKVKLNGLNLSGDWWVAYQMLLNGEYDTLTCMIQEWQMAHPGFKVYFNGNSNGYLVLADTDTRSPALPDSVMESDTYEEYKKYCKEHIGSVKANRDELVFYTKLVQDFDRLCDYLRDYCDELSNLKFELVEMERSVNYFNKDYEDDLELLGFEKLSCDENGRVDIKEIVTLSCLFEAFLRIADRRTCGYVLRPDKAGKLGYVINCE